MNKNIFFCTLIVLLCACSVTVEQAFENEGFNSETNYEPLSLHYNGHPIFSIGQTLESIDSSLSYENNNSDKYHHSLENITDHICHDSNLTIWLDNGYASGSLQFSSDNEQNRIFRIIGFWNFDLPDDSEVKDETNQQFCSKFFPILTNKVEFKEGWEQIIEHPNFKEVFKLKKNQKHDVWVLSYKVKLE
ncbi:MAG: hypothetical protein ACI8ZM_004814 [Crocinitomix sp.]|jgi:hypothetical protein